MNIEIFLGGLAAFFALAWAIFRKGGEAKDREHNEERLEANEQTHNRIDAVPPVDPANDADNDERLSRLAGRTNKR